MFVSKALFTPMRCRNATQDNERHCTTSRGAAPDPL